MLGPPKRCGIVRQGCHAPQKGILNPDRVILGLDRIVSDMIGIGVAIVADNDANCCWGILT